MRRRILAVAALAACAISAAGATAEERPAPVLEREVLARINHARQNPRALARELRDYRRHFEGNLLFLPGDVNGVVTREGAAAVDEAIAFLERQLPLPPLDAGAVLALAAMDHASDQGAAGATGHSSRDGASPGERVRRRGGDIYVGESISYGFARADDVVRQLIVDDGVPGRGHRTLLFDSAFRFAGVGCAGHRRHGHICVIDLSATADGSPLLQPQVRTASAAPMRSVPPRRRAGSSRE